MTQAAQTDEPTARPRRMGRSALPALAVGVVFGLLSTLSARILLEALLDHGADAEVPSAVSCALAVFGVPGLVACAALSAACASLLVSLGVELTGSVAGTALESLLVGGPWLVNAALFGLLFAREATRRERRQRAAHG